MTPEPLVDMASDDMLTVRQFDVEDLPVINGNAEDAEILSALLESRERLIAAEKQPHDAHWSCSTWSQELAEVNEKIRNLEQRIERN